MFNEVLTLFHDRIQQKKNITVKIGRSWMYPYETDLLELRGADETCAMTEQKKIVKFAVKQKYLYLAREGERDALNIHVFFGQMTERT